MITIIPSLEIMKAVTNSDIQGDNANNRREAFTLANELMSLADLHILIEGSMYERIKKNLKDNHKSFFESVYRIDNSVRGVTGYDHTGAIKWIADSESKTRRVIIISDNNKTYESINTKITSIQPKDFIGRAKRAIELYENKVFSSLNDSLIAVFFLAPNFP